MVDPTRRLPRVEARYHVIAPRGGYQRRLRDFDTGTSSFIDVEVEDLYGGFRHWLRVTPRQAEAVVLSPDSSSVYIVTEAQAIFIAHDGGDELRGHPVFDVWMDINTAVQVEGMPSGTLKTWEHFTSANQLGA